MTGKRPLFPRALMGLLVAWVGVLGALVLGGIADGELVCDDAYYYFEIARNASRGDGFTFDGLRPTNGFHPLWAWALVAVFRVFPASPWAPIHAALLLSLLFAAGAALGIFAFLSRGRRDAAAWIGALLWLFNPYTWVLSGRGVEGPLNACAIAWTLVALDATRATSKPRVRRTVTLGILFGICLLARTDNVLLVASLVPFAAAPLLRSRSPVRAAGRHALGLLAPMVVILAPWVIWNLSRFGTVVQTSFQAKRMFDLYGQLPPLQAVGEGPLSALVGALRNLGAVATYNARYIAGEEWGDIQRGWIVIIVAGVLLGLFAVVPWWTRRSSAAASGCGLGPMALFCACHFAWYALVSRNYYNWYFLPPVLAFCLLGGDRLGRLWALRSRPARLVAVACVGVVALSAPILTARHVPGDQARRDEREFLESPSARALAALPPGTRTGAWNSGRIGYFASFHFRDRYVINLDGVVNNDVTRYAREKTYPDYLLDHVQYVVEHPSQLTKYMSTEDALRFIEKHITREGQVLR